jgi:hypothetical protein
MSRAESPTRSIGFWSAIAVAVSSIGFDVGLLFHSVPSPWNHVAALGPSLALAPSFLVLMVCVHSTVREETQIWTRIAVAFAGVYTALCSVAYVLEILVVQPIIASGSSADVSLLTLTRPDSILNAVDGLGYVFMSAASLFAAFAFASHGIERWIRWTLLATGVLAIPIVLTYFVSPSFIYLAGPWGVTVPAAALALALRFRGMATESRGHPLHALVAGGGAPR